MSHSPLYDRALIEDVGNDVVGRVREIELLVAALGSGRHMLLEGPPGTGKSTLLRSLADRSGSALVFVEGNAELTPARLAGHFDPARVMGEGYVPDIFVDGPLVQAMRDGSLLYVEEINRVPEETLNLLITVMSEGELSVPRLGRVLASPEFRFVAAMNPFDAVGTARISGAVYDRVCRLAVDYQTGPEEFDVVLREAPGGDHDLAARAVRLVRMTREHSDVRVGSSVRGAIDLVLLAGRLADLREGSSTDDAIGLDAALASLSGRIRVHESSSRSPESIIEELWSISGGTEESGDDPGKA